MSKSRLHQSCQVYRKNTTQHGLNEFCTSDTQDKGDEDNCCIRGLRKLESSLPLLAGEQVQGPRWWTCSEGDAHREHLGATKK